MVSFLIAAVIVSVVVLIAALSARAIWSIRERFVREYLDRRATRLPEGVVLLDDYRPHRVGNVRCECGRSWVAVAPVACERLACPDCGKLTGWGES